MNIHKCDEAARWKAEVLQMMWARAKDHAAGPREAKDPTPMGHSLPWTPPSSEVPLPDVGWDAMGCHLPWMPSPLEVSPSLDATSSHRTPLPRDTGPVSIPTWQSLFLHAGPWRPAGVGCWSGKDTPPFPGRAGQGSSGQLFFLVRMPSGCRSP